MKKIETIRELQDRSWANAENHGFHETSDDVNLYVKCMLVVGEISEAIEELRSGHGPTEVYYNPEKPNKPEGFPVEIADAFIRLADLCGIAGFDSEDVINLKHEYNLTRPRKHGKVV